MTNWPLRRSGSPRVAATGEELLAGAAGWYDVCPRGGRGDPAFEKWRADFRAWCADRGTDPLAILRLRAAEKCREAGG